MHSRALLRGGLLCLAVLPLLTCGTTATAAPTAAAPQSIPSASAPATTGPGASVSEMPTLPAPPTLAPPTIAPAPPPQPPQQYLPVSFTGLAAGTYPVHLHAICNGRQGYHIAYLPDLHVSAAGSGAIEVPAAYFGQGWCVVVYANRAATAVAAFRPV